MIGGGVGGTPTNPGSGAVLGGADIAEILARSNGEPCDADGECLSNNCYDEPGGICCNESCTDVCSSCYAAQQADPLAAGNGVCAIVADNTPVSPQCVAAVELVIECVGGQIDISGVESCEEYACSGDQCGTSCTNNAHCNIGFYCSLPNCVPKLEDGVGCANGFQCQSGHCVDGVCCNAACGGQCQEIGRAHV